MNTFAFTNSPVKPLYICSQPVLLYALSDSIPTLASNSQILSAALSVLLELNGVASPYVPLIEQAFPNTHSIS